jgi:tetratricopeptide (TPR) repeat protein
MQWRAGILAAACGFVICRPAAGQKIGKPAPEVTFSNSSFSIESNNGKILVLVFWRSDDQRSIDAIPILNDVYEKLRSKGVVIMALTSEEKDTVQKAKKDLGIRYRTGWSGNWHQTYEVSSFPRAVLIDTVGTVVWKGNPSDDLELRIREQLIRTPTAGSNTAALRTRLSEAEQLSNPDDLGRAFLLAGNVAEVAEEESDIAKKAEKLKEQLEKSAADRLEEVRKALRSSDFEKAGELAAMLGVYFKSAQVGRDAKQEIDRIRADSKGKDAYNKAVKAARAVRQTDVAAAMEKSKQYHRAIEAYQEVVDKYSGAEAAKTAGDAIERIKNDPAVKRHLKSVRADEQADRWFDIGERFDRLDMAKEAKEYYEKVVTTHPDSRAAKRARAKLKG